MANRNIVQSLTRGLEILEHVAHSDNGLTLQDLSRVLGLKPPTVHNLARTLMAKHYLEKRPQPTRYILGPAVHDVTARHGQRQFRQEAAEVVRGLAVRLPSATITLTEVSGGEVATTLRVDPARPTVLEQPQHRFMPAYASASALVFQALWSQEQRSAYRHQYPFDEYGAATWGTEARLEEFLADVRRVGYAVLPAGNSDKFRVAAPVFSAQHELVATLGGARFGPAADPAATDAGIVEHVVAAARGLSEVGEAK